MGMSLEDFGALTPDEFGTVFTAWAEEREVRSKEEWERMRLLAAATIQPHCSGRITPASLFTFPWDNKTAKPEEGAAPAGKEESHARFLELMARKRASSSNEE